MLAVPPGMRVWLAAGHTDMRRGMNGLAVQVSTAKARNKHRDMLRRLGAARDTVWITELGDSVAERSCRAIWGGQ